MRENLVENTAGKLLEYIRLKEFNMGDKLPNEYALAEELHVGRSTIREVVKVLVARNILQVRQGSGTYISEGKGIVKDPLGFSLIKNKNKMIEDLFVLRYILEPPMAALAAKNATENQISHMIRLKDAIEVSFKNNTDEHVALDIELHKTIAEASGNIALSHIVPIINESIALFNENYNVSNLKTETIELHDDLVNAIAKHDELNALDAMTVHMANNRKEFSKVIQSN
ncbi:GntR family transcriptional regulator [Listeria newyorkensis]|uniref:GntR family transcriptional regulator n=1 Tax=Listeria newyorkensis TaxID=1497681 RepID=A0ABX4XL77_9LIST|nr:FCD domain-containing protein [Listeria newyorkensis]KGL42506.1 GntR family transcriptional regulator [Listeria newyorkensis]KMT60322.1 GntR family transcriptional regulator [Listeria newyorkensis]PNP90972.1 GntR family transcriptional regulator [Listeria newyorkensis]WAO20330.1 FCD domain-containing protein [Listeria newyorkensis]SQC55480.1 L-lactate utilization operon repressor [Listeria newyorkensis]